MKKLWKRISLAALVGVAVGLATQSLPIGAAAFGVLAILAIIPTYLKYSADNPNHLWFKRKLFGWGWTPVTWQGWLVIAVYIALISALGFSIPKDAALSDMILPFFVPITILSLVLIFIAYRKGEKPRWQWGKDIEKYD